MGSKNKIQLLLRSFSCVVTRIVRVQLLGVIDEICTCARSLIPFRMSLVSGIVGIALVGMVVPDRALAGGTVL